MEEIGERIDNFSYIFTIKLESALREEAKRIIRTKTNVYQRYKPNRPSNYDWSDSYYTNYGYEQGSTDNYSSTPVQNYKGGGDTIDNHKNLEIFGDQVHGFGYIPNFDDIEQIQEFRKISSIAGNDIFRAYEFQFMHIFKLYQTGWQFPIIEVTDEAVARILNYLGKINPPCLSVDEIEQGLLYGRSAHRDFVDFIPHPKSQMKWKLSSMFSKPERVLLSSKHEPCAILQDGLQCNPRVCQTDGNFKYGFRRLFPFEREGSYHMHGIPQNCRSTVLAAKYAYVLTGSAEIIHEKAKQELETQKFNDNYLKGCYLPRINP